MRVLRFVGLGFIIWELSLLWPQVNQFLTSSVMIGLVFGLGAVTLAYVLVRRFNHDYQDNSAGQDHPTHPMPAAVTR
jgi:uncharacterized protein (DUF2062 family)